MSDWALGKKLNSRVADVPINHLIWLNDYKTYGENSYVFQNKDILHELYRSPISANDVKILGEAFTYITDNETSFIGKFLASAYDLKDCASALSSYTSISDIVLDDACVDRIIASNFKSIFFENQDVVDVYSLSVDGLNAASSNNAVMTALESSEKFKKQVASLGVVQEKTGESADGKPAISVKNAYIITSYVGCARMDSGAIYARGGCSCKYHGDSSLKTVVSPMTYQSSNVGTAAVSNKFVRELIITASSGDSRYKYSVSSNSIKYIQLDNVV